VSGVVGKPTPGPWRIRTNGNIGNAVEAECGLRSPLFADNGFRTVATFQSCCASDRYDEQEANALANARLIAAAPELLEALQGIIEIGKRDLSNPKYDGFFTTARAAIARATGEGNE
jgi:hypothetical protein